MNKGYSYPSRLLIHLLGIVDEVVNLFTNLINPIHAPIFYCQLSMSYMVYLSEKKVRREIREREQKRKDNEQQYEKLKGEAIALLEEDGKDI